MVQSDDQLSVEAATEMVDRIDKKLWDGEHAGKVDIHLSRTQLRELLVLVSEWTAKLALLRRAKGL